MARIVDKDTRIIDIEFGPVDASITRTAGAFDPTTVVIGSLSINQPNNGVDQVIGYVEANEAGGGSFVQYQRVDLSYMLQQNEVMQPLDVSVQRTSPVPLGFSNDGNNYDQIEEYIYIFTRPLNNNVIGNLADVNDYDTFRSMGLDRSESLTASSSVAGSFFSGQPWPDKEQCIYAEKRMYSTNLNNAATQTNGALLGTSLYNELCGMPNLDSVTTWGSLNSITGPNLHCYRIILDRSQSFPPAAVTFANEAKDGSTLRRWPPVNVSFLCRDPNYSEGEYITRIANAMNAIPEGGRTND